MVIKGRGRARKVMKDEVVQKTRDDQGHERDQGRKGKDDEGQGRTK